MSFDREAWLIVARGGWWTPQEIAELMPKDLEVNMTPKAVYSRLWVTAKRGFLTRRTVGPQNRPGASEYAVTATCRAPLGLTVGEIMNALGGRA